jgi:mediator of replication checkpoint protein 1
MRSLSPQKRANAFDVLAQNAKAESAKLRKRLEKSEFVEAEAQESDDDEMFGFGLKKDDGEEEDGEDLDKTLDGLVDDQEMDEKTVAAAMVLEKFKSANSFIFVSFTDAISWFAENKRKKPTALMKSCIWMR